jgi:flagellar biosynthesis protein FliR
VTAVATSVSFSPNYAIALVLALVRASTWVVICPPFSNKSIPAMAKIGIALGLAVFAARTLQYQPMPTGTAQLLGQVVVQAVIGFVLGFVVYLFVQAVTSAGSLVDLFSGLNLPAAIDPLSLQQTPLFGQFYNLVATALIFTTGAAVVIVGGFLRSFHAVGTKLPNVTAGKLAAVITSDVTTFFAAAVEIAAPVIAVLFAAQILLGLLAKATPQINVFVFGMPLQILLALSAVGLALFALPDDVTHLVGRATSQIFGG